MLEACKLAETVLADINENIAVRSHKNAIEIKYYQLTNAALIAVMAAVAAAEGR